jgi:hypothetical protein
MAQLGSESGELVDSVFKKKYHTIMESTKPSENGGNIWFPNWKPFEVYCPSDQKFSWLATKAGGAALGTNVPDVVCARSGWFYSRCCA